MVGLGDEDFLLVWGDTSRPGDDTLPERSSDVIDRLALWELSERSLKYAPSYSFIFKGYLSIYFSTSATSYIFELSVQ